MHFSNCLKKSHYSWLVKIRIQARHTHCIWLVCLLKLLISNCSPTHPFYFHLLYTIYRIPHLADYFFVVRFNLFRYRCIFYNRLCGKIFRKRCNVFFSHHLWRHAMSSCHYFNDAIVKRWINVSGQRSLSFEILKTIFFFKQMSVDPLAVTWGYLPSRKNESNNKIAILFQSVSPDRPVIVFFSIPFLSLLVSSLGRVHVCVLFSVFRTFFMSHFFQEPVITWGL